MARNERDGGMTYATTTNNANEFAPRILSAESSPWNESIAEERYKHDNVILSDNEITCYTYIKF